MFSKFQQHLIDVGEAMINLKVGGGGPMCQNSLRRSAVDTFVISLISLKRPPGL